jgi:hypothetical protein
VVPSSHCLLQITEKLVQLTHQLAVGGVNEAYMLGAVERLGEGVVEEGVIDVEMVHRPASRDSQSQHCVDGGRLHHRTESFIVVHIRELGEPPKDSMSLVPIQRTINLEVVLESQNDLPGLSNA